MIFFSFLVWISILNCFIFTMCISSLLIYFVFRYFRHASGSLVILSKNLAQYININRLVLMVLNVSFFFNSVSFWKILSPILSSYLVIYLWLIQKQNVVYLWRHMLIKLHIPKLFVFKPACEEWLLEMNFDSGSGP